MKCWESDGSSGGAIDIEYIKHDVVEDAVGTHGDEHVREEIDCVM